MKPRNHRSPGFGFVVYSDNEVMVKVDISSDHRVHKMYSGMAFYPEYGLLKMIFAEWIEYFEDKPDRAWSFIDLR